MCWYSLVSYCYSWLRHPKQNWQKQDLESAGYTLDRRLPELPLPQHIHAHNDGNDTDNDDDNADEKGHERNDDNDDETSYTILSFFYQKEAKRLRKFSFFTQETSQNSNYGTVVTKACFW